MRRAVTLGTLGGQEQGLGSEVMGWPNARTHLESKMSPKPEHQVGIRSSNKFVGYRRLVKDVEGRDER